MLSGRPMAPPLLALVLVAAAYVLPLALPVPLMEDDEGLHAAIAIEMVERGDWTVPRLLGEPFRDKPILYFWMQAASLAAFGPSEFAVRLPGMVLAFAAMLATFWLGRTLFGHPAGAWGAVAYGTMLLPFAVSLAPLHDLVMVPLVALAFGAFWRLHHARTSGARAAWTLAAGVVLGLSILGKGLTGVGLVGVGMVAWMAWTRTWSLALVAGAAVALVIGALIAWPWYAAMEQASPGYLTYFFLQRHVEGVAGDTQRHAGRPFWYYLPILVAGAWPWIVDVVRRPFGTATAADRLLWAWLVADVLLLSAAGSKLATYVLPTFPALALLAGRRAVADAPDGAAAARAMATIVVGVLPMAGALAVQRLMGTPPAPWLGLVAALAPLALLGWSWEGERRHAWSWPARMAVVAAASSVLVGVLVRPLVAAQLTAKGLAAHFDAAPALPERLYIVDEGVGSFLFYLRPDLRRGLTAERVQRVSRFSLADVPPAPGTEIAVAAERLPGVLELYDLPAGSTAVGAGVESFHVFPRDGVRPRSR